MDGVGRQIDAGDPLAAEIDIFSREIPGTITFCQGVASYGPEAFHRF